MVITNYIIKLTNNLKTNIRKVIPKNAKNDNFLLFYFLMVTLLFFIVLSKGIKVRILYTYLDNKLRVRLNQNVDRQNVLYMLLKYWNVEKNQSNFTSI